MADRTTLRAQRVLQLKPKQAYLGKLDGAVLDSASGKYWVRQIMSTGSAAPPVRLRLMPGSALPEAAGMVVDLVYHNPTGELMIKGVNAEVAAAQGLSTALTNPLSRAARGYGYQEEQGALKLRRHPDQPYWGQVLPGIAVMDRTVVRLATASAIDLTSLRPASGQHRYVSVFLKADGTLVSGGSTAQSTSSALDLTDAQEAYDAGPSGSLCLGTLYATISDLSDSPSAALDLRNQWGGYLTQFLSLIDTPDSYSGQGSKLVRVNAGASALEFAALAASSLTTRWEPLTNGDAASPELVFANGDVIMVEVAA